MSVSLLFFFFSLYSNETVYLSFIDWTSVAIHFVGHTSHLTFNVACLACPMLKLHAKCAINTRLPWHIAHFKKQKNRCEKVYLNKGKCVLLCFSNKMCAHPWSKTRSNKLPNTRKQIKFSFKVPLFFIKDTKNHRNRLNRS